MADLFGLADVHQTKHEIEVLRAVVFAFERSAGRVIDALFHRQEVTDVVGGTQQSRGEIRLEVWTRHSGRSRLQICLRRYRRSRSRRSLNALTTSNRQSGSRKSSWSYSEMSSPSARSAAAFMLPEMPRFFSRRHQEIFGSGCALR